MSVNAIGIVGYPMAGYETKQTEGKLLIIAVAFQIY